MATLTKEQIEQLKQQLLEKQKEVKAIMDQLIEAGELEMPDDLADQVAGGGYTYKGEVFVGRSNYTATTDGIITRDE